MLRIWFLDIKQVQVLTLLLASGHFSLYPLHFLDIEFFLLFFDLFSGEIKEYSFFSQKLTQLLMNLTSCIETVSLRMQVLELATVTLEVMPSNLLRGDKTYMSI